MKQVIGISIIDIIDFSVSESNAKSGRPLWRPTWMPQGIYIILSLTVLGANLLSGYIGKD